MLLHTVQLYFPRLNKYKRLWKLTQPQLQAQNSASSHVSATTNNNAAETVKL